MAKIGSDYASRRDDRTSLMKVDFFVHNLGDEEINEAVKALRSLFLTTGKYVDDLEESLAKYLEVKYTVGLTSCTAALHLSLLAAGVEPGDEVLTTPMSFVATTNSIVMAGATPVFVDVEANTGNIDANLIEKAITAKTKAILPVHLYGQMVDMKKIMSIAKKHNLKVIEDSAHALEAQRDNIRPGQLSFGACFSFYATKSITSAEGGAFATNDLNVAKLMKKLRSHGITNELAQRERTGLKTYDVDVLGWKYNMDNVQAAILINQVKKIEKQWKKREEIAQEYRKAFEKIGIDMPYEYPGIKHGRHIFAIWVDPSKRDTILDYLNKNGVGAVINYPAIHLFTFYKKMGFRKGQFPNAEEIASREITLPLYSKLKEEEVDYVIKKVIEAVKI